MNNNAEPINNSYILNKDEYISDHIDSSEIQKWQQGSFIYINAPTGAGKTNFIINTLLPQTDKKKVLYVCNRIALKEQIKIQIFNKLINKKEYPLDKADEYIIKTTNYNQRYIPYNTRYDSDRVFPANANFYSILRKSLTYVISKSELENNNTSIFGLADNINTLNSNLTTVTSFGGTLYDLIKNYNTFGNVTVINYQELEYHLKNAKYNYISMPLFSCRFICLYISYY